MPARDSWPPGEILDLAKLVARRRAWSAAERRVVLTNGCFDLLHVGHVRYLAAAKQLGDVLVVALNDDTSTRALKGPGHPIVPLGDRAELLGALRAVDAVVPFGDPTAVELVRLARPDVYVKGGDYDEDRRRPPEADVAAELGASVVYLPFVPGRSTSDLLDRVQRLWR